MSFIFYREAKCFDGIKIAGRNINNLRYADDTTLMAESEEDVRDMGSFPGSGRSHGGEHGNPLPYSCLGSPWTEEPGRLQSVGYKLNKQGDNIQP